MKPPTRGLASLTYLSKSEEVTFWNLVKQHLSNHEIERFSNLQNVKTDVGRGRAWLRCSLNEGSLKRYLQMLLGDTTLLKKYYETEAFLLDEELASTLPHMAAGLTSLYFNISYDNASLDGSTVAQSPSLPALLNAAATTLTSKTSHHTDNKSFEEATFPKTVTTRVGKKKRSKIISFSDDDESDCSATLSQASEDAPGSSKSDQVLLHSSSSSKTLKKNGHSPQNESKTSLYDKSSPLKQKDAASYQEHSDVEDTSSTSDGHDVIMDELIIRTPSSSTSGLLFPAENETVTLLPVQYDDDDDDDDDLWRKPTHQMWWLREFALGTRHTQWLEPELQFQCCVDTKSQAPFGQTHVFTRKTHTRDSRLFTSVKQESANSTMKLKQYEMIINLLPTSIQNIWYSFHTTLSVQTIVHGMLWINKALDY